MITIVGWLAWLVFAASVALELLALVSGFRIHVQLPGLGGAQRFSAGLLLAVVAMVASPLPAVQAAPPAANAPMVSNSASQASTERPTPAAVSESRAPETVPMAQSPSQQAAAAGLAGERQVTHRVAPGDDLWSLAEHYYGEGRQWRKIAQANPDRLTGGPDRLE
ncbi:MAG: hypothetical protein ABWX96_20515, partial [Propionibacteriaceae bacterium]